MGSRIGTGIPGGLLIPAKITHDQLQAVASPPGPVDSDYTQSVSRPGHGVPTDDLSRLVAHVHASQAEDIVLRTIKSGMPGREGVQVAYRKGSEASTNFRGWNPPNYPNGSAMVEFGANVFDRFDAVTIPSTQKVVVFTTDTTLPGDGAARIIDPETRIVSSAGATISKNGEWDYPALVVIPETERVLVQFANTIRYSDDLGVTWAIYSETPVPGASLANFGRVRMAYHRTDIGMIVEDRIAAGTVHQWASSALGATFTEVGEFAALGDSVDMVSTHDGIFIFYLRDADNRAVVRRLSSPFELLTFQDETLITPLGIFGDGAITADPSGTLYAHLRVSGTGDIELYESVDAGVTWTLHQDDVATPSSNAFLTNFKAVSSFGSTILFANWITSTSTEEGIQALWLGGWQAVTANGGQPPPTRRGFDEIWTAIELPQNTGGTWAEVGGGSVLVSPGEMRRFTNGVVPNLVSYHTRSNGPVAAVEQLILTQVRVTIGGSLANKDVTIHGKIAQAAFSFEWSVSLSTTGFRIRDENTGGTLGTDALMDLTSDIVLLLWATHGAITTYWWRPGESTVNIGPSGALSLLAVAGTNDITWGHEDSGGTATSFWTQFHLAERQIAGGLGGSNIYKPQIGADEIKGKPLTRVPVPVPDLGVSPLAGFISASAGPARRDDGYNIAAEYDFPITNVFPRLSPSPDSRWRSNGLSEQVLTFQFDDDMWLGDSIGMYISGANFRTAVLESSVDGSSWDLRGTLNLAEGFEGLNAVRSGATLVPGAGSAEADRYLFEETLTNGWVEASPAEWRVTQQSAGGWSGGITAKPVLTLEGVQGGDPNGAIAGVRFVFTSGLLVIHLASQVLVPLWRVRIPAQVSPDTYFEAGIIMVGKIAAFGDRIDWGRGDEMIPNTVVTRDNYGTSRARQLGPPAKRWSLHWQSGTNHCEIRSGSDVDYVGPTVGIPMVGDEDVLYRLFGHIRETKGGEIPCLAIEEIPDEDTSITDETRFLYGRLTSSARGNNTAGDLGTDEQQRIEGLVFEEIK